jgi:predicted ATPase
LCNVLAQAACPVSLYAGDLAAAERFTAMLLDQAARDVLDVFHAYGRCFKGMLLITQSDVDVGLQLLRAAADELRRETRWAQFHTAFLGELAEGFAAAGDAVQGLTTIDEALARFELTEERWVTADLLRIRGELLLLNDEPKAAEEHFRQALDWARRQDALSWELRAATSLARLWHPQRRTSPARKLLAPVYARFTEGFRTANLIAAKSLLASLR